MTDRTASTETADRSVSTSQPAEAAAGWPETLGDGTRFVIRPIHARDLELERRFIESLSPTSRRFRFLDTMKSPSPGLLKQLTVINPATDVAYLAVVEVDGEALEIGAARFCAGADREAFEFAIVVSDAWQNKGVGTRLMQRLLDAARLRGIKTLHSSDAADNGLMRKFAARLNFKHAIDPEDATHVLYTVDLTAPHG